MLDYFSYLRVSTDKQGITGLGMDAQRESVLRYVSTRGRLLAEFIEVESGRKENRPQLKAALEECRKRKAVLLIARLDRLARNVAFIANLMNSDVEFVAVDMPQANRLTIHILAAVAERDVRPTMMQQSQQQQPTDINQWQSMMMMLVYNVCSIVTTPIEMALRPVYGSTYIPPFILCLSAIMMILAPVLDGLFHMIPFIGGRPSPGLFDIGTFTKLFFLGACIHNFRIWRKMVHPESEKFSWFEGPPLPIFRIVPGTFWMIRIIYEPIFVFLVAVVLGNFFVLQSSAVNFLVVSAMMLAMKEYVAWYMTWVQIRQLMDARNAGPIIAKIIDNSATDDELASIHLASLPKDIPEDLRRQTASFIARAFTGTDIPGEKQ